MPNPNRIAAERRGRRAETYAKLWLSLKGYHIAHMRYKTKAGEIDMIARKKDMVVFVEVKARAALDAAELSLFPQMQSRIERASDIFVSRTAWAQPLTRRFDAVFVVPGFLSLPKIIHRKDAWRAW